jgi:hypothetical protein
MFTHKKSSFFEGLKATNACLSSSDNIGNVRDRVQNNFYKEMAAMVTAKHQAQWQAR